MKGEMCMAIGNQEENINIKLKNEEIEQVDRIIQGHNERGYNMINIYSSAQKFKKS